VDAEGLSFTVSDLDGRRTTYGPVTGSLVIEPGAGDVPAVSVDGKPVSPVLDTGSGSGGAQKPPDDVIVTPQPSPSLVAAVRGGRLKLSKAGVASIRVKVSGGGATGTVTLSAKLGRRTVKIGSARVTLPDGRTVKARVKVSRAARRAVGRRGLRAVARLSVPGTAPAQAAVRLRR
jgi:hypothetical protein